MLQYSTSSLSYNIAFAEENAAMYQPSADENGYQQARDISEELSNIKDEKEDISS